MFKSTDEKLKEVQDSLLENLEEEENMAIMTDEISKDIFERLLSKGECVFEVNEREYTFKMKYTKSFVVIFAIDNMKFKIAKEKYKPFIIQSQIEEEFGLEETLLASIKAFVKKQYGIIEAEEM